MGEFIEQIQAEDTGRVDVLSTGEALGSVPSTNMNNKTI